MTPKQHDIAMTVFAMAVLGAIMATFIFASEDGARENVAQHALINEQ